MGGEGEKKGERAGEREGGSRIGGREKRIKGGIDERREGVDDEKEEMSETLLLQVTKQGWLARNKAV